MKYLIFVVVGATTLLVQTPAYASALIAYLDDNQQIIVSPTDGAFGTTGLDFVSVGGFLIPPTGFTPASAVGPGFAGSFLLTGTSNQVTIGSLGTPLSIDGDFATGIGYTGDLLAGDLRAAYGDGPTPIDLPFRVGDTLVVGGGTNPPSGGNDPMNPTDPTDPMEPDDSMGGDMGGGGVTDPGSGMSGGGGTPGGGDVGGNPGTSGGGANAVPEPTSMLVWLTLGMLVSWKQWSSCRVV